MHCCLTHGPETLMGCRFRASCSQLPQLTHVAIPAHHGCVCHSHPLSFASLQEIRLGVVMTAGCHGRKNWIEPHEINLSNLFVLHIMGCVSPFTAFPTRGGYVVFQCFAPGREWRNCQLLSLPSEEGEGADNPPSAPWCETGVYRDWGKCTNRLSNASNSQPGERERSGRICSHPSFITLVSTQEKLLEQNYIYTNRSAPLLFLGPVQTPLHCKEGSARPQLAMELDHLRRAQGTALRCFSTLGCSIDILIASCLFPELLPAALSHSPTVSTSTEPETPCTREFMLHIRGDKEPSPAHIIALHLHTLLWDAVEITAKNQNIKPT